MSSQTVNCTALFGGLCSHALLPNRPIQETNWLGRCRHKQKTARPCLEDFVLMLYYQIDQSRRQTGWVDVVTNSKLHGLVWRTLATDFLSFLFYDCHLSKVHLLFYYTRFACRVYWLYS